MITLKDLCDKGSSNIAQKDIENNNGEFPIYGASGFIKNVDFYKQEKPYIAIVKDGAGVGRVMKLPAMSSVIGTMQYIIPNEGVNVDYLAYALESMNLAKYHSGATIPHIYFKDYCKEVLPEHSKLEQNRIAVELSKIDSLITARREQLAKLDELVKSRFIELFGERLERDTVKLSTLTEVITKGTTPTTLGFEFAESGVNFVKIECITEDSKFIVPKMLHISDECNQKLKRSILQEGDVLFSIAGAIGRTAIVTKEILPANTNQAVAIIRLQENCGLNAMFLNQMLHSSLIEEQVNVKKSGVAQINLSLADIGDFNVIVPPIEEQARFAAFVEQTDKSKLAIQQSLEKLETLKKALMQKYFG